MKYCNNVKLFLVSIMLFAGATAFAQTDPFESDILKMQQINGSSGTTDAMFSQIVAQLKSAKPDVTEAKWAALKKDVFDVEVKDLQKMLVPVYKKYFTPEEVKSIIAFYESPVGKKLAGQTPQITTESMQVTQQWGMGLFGKIQSYLN